MVQMRTIGINLDRGHRNDLNFNFSKLESLVTSASNLTDEMRQEFLLKIADLQSQINALKVEEILALISQMEQAVINTNTAATLATSKAEYAEGEGDYAKEQGDYANAQGTYANEKGDYANEKAVLANEAAALAQQESSNLGQMKIEVVQATQNAVTETQKAITATENSEQATTASIVATTNAENMRSVGAFVLSNAYKKNNIVEDNGSSFMALQNTQNNPLPVLPSKENAWWRLLVQKGVKGDRGESFTVNAQGLFSERANYDSEIEGFAYLATDVGELYFRQGASGWSEGIAFGKGEPGEPGEPGVAGKDGATFYTWIKYADTDTGTGMSDAPTGKKYIGIAYNKATPTKSNVASDYAWSLIQGAKGDTGTTSYLGLTDVPEEFTPSPHAHPISQVVDLQTTLDDIRNNTAGIATNVNGLYRDVAYLKLQQEASDRIEGGVTFADDMNGNRFGMTFNQMESTNIKIRDGKMLMINEVSTPVTVTDATVVASAYDTSGNSGRRLVRMTDGTLVTVVTNKSANDDHLLYKSINNGSSWTNIASVLEIPNTSNATIIPINPTHVALLNASKQSGYWAVKVTTINVNSGAKTDTTIDNNQTALGNVSLAINEQGTELHASWASKNATYPNSFNIRYAKGTISADGSVTWGAAEQITTLNTTGTNLVNPSIVVNSSNKPVIISEFYNSANFRIVVSYKDASNTWIGSIGLTVKDVYNGTSYTQSSPSAIFVPKSVNGLANGRIWVAWEGKDSVDVAKTNIRVSYSDDGGVTWSAMQKLTSGNTYSRAFPSITADKDNNIYILFGGQGASNNGISMSKNTNNAWGSIQTVSSMDGAYYPSALFDLTVAFTIPLFIFYSYTKVGFYGTWTNVTGEPSLTATAVYDLPPTDYVGAYVQKEGALAVQAKLNGAAMDSELLDNEYEFTKQTTEVSPTKLRLELSRATINGGESDAVTRILGGRA
ncbi:hypothetical protein [Psychrobacillus antarcticus]|uniref:hypothetical protein n=1 Tax=Psychrobacillus antarcticus TaxID=2879115 RepID=UPI0024085CCE|nr:hypothetical protein [Psychrobacillus antarcticus]